MFAVYFELFKSLDPNNMPKTDITVLRSAESTRLQKEVVHSDWLETSQGKLNRETQLVRKVREVFAGLTSPIETLPFLRTHVSQDILHMPQRPLVRVLSPHPLSSPTHYAACRGLPAEHTHHIQA